MNIELIAHNAIILLGAAINICLIFFVLYMSRKHVNMPIITFIAMTFFVVIYQLSHVVGILAPNAEASRGIFMFNLVVIPIALFLCHWLLSLSGTDKIRRGKIFLGIAYATGIIFLITFTIYPETYLLDSIPKLYFPFYYEAGRFQIYMRAWQFVVATYALIELAIAYRKTADPVERNRYKWVFAGVTFGFFLGFTAALLVYDIQFDPFWSSFFGFYTLPLAYAMVRYELFDIRVLAKRAILYASAIISAGVIIAAVNLGNDYIISTHPGFPAWIGQIIVSIIVGIGGVFIWRKAREADLLKYQFLTIVTHKFRTPLTRIKWSLDEADTNVFTSPEIKGILENIRKADSELVELTNVLTTLSDSDAASHLYQFKEELLSDIVTTNAEPYRPLFQGKKINFTITTRSINTPVFIDREKISFVIQILLDNALMYTKAGGIVDISTDRVGNEAVFTVTDSGIGIPKVNRTFLFNKFYRAPNARAESTEGAGIGLFMAKLIIERNGGSIAVESDGEGKGTTFRVSFKLNLTTK